MQQTLSFTERLAELFFPAIGERRNLLERKLVTDELTKLGNRAAFNKVEPDALKKKQAFIIFDANNFGHVNKQCGHRRGDEVLQDIARVIGEVSRKFKVQAFRYAGDEFVIIAPPRFAARVRDAVERKFLPQDFGNFVVSVSGTVGATFAEADALLQARKREAKNAR